MHAWIRKHRPETIDEVEGQDKAISQLKDFVVNFNKQKKKALFAHGPVGVGKTCSVYALANDLGYEVLEVNASDSRNQEQINYLLGNAIKQQSLFRKGKIILVDELDGISGRKDRGGASAIAKLIEISSFPIIMTANDPWNKKLKSVRSKSILVEFHHLNYLSINNVLKNICKKEKISFDETLLKSLARRVGGDLRAAINDLQRLTGEKKEIKNKDLEDLGEREQRESIIQALIKVFKTTDPSVAKAAFDNVDEDLDKIILWLDENLPKEYTKADDLIKAYEKLSRADVFKGRIRRWQHWRFLVYIYDLITAGIALSKDEKYKGFVKYGPTTRIFKLWRANMKYMKRKAIAEKVAQKTHTSKKGVIKDTLPYLQVMFRNKDMRKQLSDYFDFDKEETDWLKA